MTTQDQVLSQSSEKSKTPRYRAVWNGAVLAESDATVVVEGNHYFPIGEVRTVHLQASDSHTVCHWKGVACYYHVVVRDDVNRHAVCVFPVPSKLAETINGHFA